MSMRLRVGFGKQFVFAGRTLSSGDEFEVPEGTAMTLLASGLVLPVDGDWRGVMPTHHNA